MSSEEFAQMIVDDDIDFEKYLQETELQEKIRPASAFLDDIMHELAPAYDPRAIVYPALPFGAGRVQFRDGEVTMWAGYNGSGKSLLQGQVFVDISERGHKCCIASLEMKPKKTLARMVRQKFFDGGRLSKNEVKDLLDRIGGNLFLYDQQGTVRQERMVAVIKHCAENLGIKHFAVDSLMKCIRGTDDYNGQKDFVDVMTSIARDFNIHIHIVAHMKKGESDEKLPTRYDMKGAAEISDLADNVLIVWRNKIKERAIQRGEKVSDETPDTIIRCDKQRNGEWEGLINLWYDPNNLSFTERQLSRPISAPVLNQNITHIPRRSSQSYKTRFSNDDD